LDRMEFDNSPRRGVVVLCHGCQFYVMVQSHNVFNKQTRLRSTVQVTSGQRNPFDVCAGV
jgi:hypothetical protein